MAGSEKPGRAGLWKKRERREEEGEEQRPRVFQLLLSGGGSKIKFGGEEGGKEIKQEQGRRTQRVLGRGREARLTPDGLTDLCLQNYLQRDICSVDGS